MSNTTTNTNTTKSTKSKKTIKTKNTDNIEIETNTNTDEIQEQPKQPEQSITNIPTKSYKVILDIDKDLDLLLVCCVLNKHNIKSYVEYGEIISFGTYSDLNNALKIKSNIESLGFKVLIQGV